MVQLRFFALLIGQFIVGVPFETSVTVAEANNHDLAIEIDISLSILDDLFDVVTSRQSSKVAKNYEQHVTLRRFDLVQITIALMNLSK